MSRTRVGDGTVPRLPLFEGLFDAAPDAVIVVDDRGLIRLVNQPAERLFGYGRDDLVGRPIETLVPERFHQAHLGHRAGYMHDPRARPMGLDLELFARRRDGTEFPADVSLSFIPTFEGDLVATAVRDATTRRRTERTLTALNEVASAAQERFERVFRVNPSGITLTRLADGIMVDANERFLELLGRAHDEVVGRTALALGLFADPVAHEHLVEDLRADGSTRDREVMLRAAGGTSLQVLVSAELLDLDGVPHILAAFVDITERKRTEDELRVRSAQQEALIALGQLAIAGTPFAELVERAVVVVARSLDVPFVKAIELLPDGEACVVTAGAGWPKGVIGASVPLTQTGECELALRTGAPVIVEDVATEARFAPPALVVALGVRSSLCVAIGGRDRPLGTIDVHAREPHHFGDADARYLQAVASVLASAGRRELDERTRVERSLVLGSLTAREREVLRLLAEGRNNREIAELLGIRYSTVRGHVRAVIEKLGVRSKLQAVARAHAVGLLPSG